MRSRRRPRGRRTRGRAGNNYRVRWTIDNDTLDTTTWSTIAFTFRFSTDGVNWFTIGQGNGPDGGSPRTLVHYAGDAGAP